MRQIPLYLLVCVMGIASTACSKNFSTRSTTFGETVGSNLPGTFESHNRKDIVLRDYLGQTVVLVFGFTQCPDVCPTTIQHWQQVFSLLTVEEAEETQFVFVTVDPTRDSAETLASYLSFFDPSFVGLRSDQKTLNALLNELHTFARKVPSRTPGQYTMDHTGSAYLIGSQGVLVDELPFGTDIQNSAKRLSQVISTS